MPEGVPEARVPEAVRFGIEYADRVIDPDHRRWLAGLPLIWGGRMGGRSVLLSHGSPFRPLEEYLYPNRIPQVPLELFDFDGLAFGQTHRPYLDTSRRPFLLNPGSIGQARPRPGVACAARWDPEAATVEMLEYPFDPTPVISLARNNGAGDWITKHLL